MDVHSNIHTTKTDLGLLLECLKFQMKCPESQKQALLAIFSICQTREENVDLFREMGGVAFIYSLAKSSVVHPDVKETALYTLATLAETNAHCKMSLCRKETFSHLLNLLTTQDNTVTQRRVAVYLLSVLVAKNKLGQTFAQNTGCLDILLDLFRNSFPFSTDATPMPLNVSQTYQLWTSVSSALCGCVNNPQNEEAQRICVAAYPLIKTWLQRTSLRQTEMFQPLCTFIAMSVGNNSRAQDSFSSSGCLETLTLTLTRVAADAEKSLLSCQISVIITKTLSACVADNAVLATGLFQYGLVPRLLSLLSSPNLDPQDRLPVLLTMGHCTEASEEHQRQLVQCGGLSTIITLLTEYPSEELRKAATFILETCKQATSSLGGPGPGEEPREEGDAEPFTGSMDAYWKSANELLHRIHQLEKRQRGAAGTSSPERRRGREEETGGGKGREEDRREFTPPPCRSERAGPRGEGAGWGRERRRRWRRDRSSGPETDVVTDTEAGPLTRPPRRKCHGDALRSRPERRHQASERQQEDGEPLMRPFWLYSQPGEGRGRQASERRADGGDESLPGERGRPDVLRPVFRGTGAVVTSNLAPLEGTREPHAVRCNQGFNPPAPTNPPVGRERKWIGDEDAMSLCSELLDGEVRKLMDSCGVRKLMDSGVRELMDSGVRKLLDGGVRKLQQSPEAVATPSGERCSGCVLSFDEVTSRTFSALQSSCRHSCDMHRALREATGRYRALRSRTAFAGEQPGGGVEPAPDRHAEEAPQRGGGSWRGRGAGDAVSGQLISPPGRDTNSTRRVRQDFTREEVKYLLVGAKKFGSSWNCILWSFPFQRGRTNVDLARKHRQLMKSTAPDLDFT